MKPSWTNAFQISYFTSAPFKFAAEGEEFFVHPGLISRLSKPLGSLIENPFRSEKKWDYNNLPKDVSAATFDRFLEWAYQGYYTEPSPTIDPKIGREIEAKTGNAPRPTTSEDTGPEMPAVEEETPQPPAEDWGLGGYKTQKKIRKEKARKSLWDAEEIAVHPPEPAPTQRADLRKAFCSFTLPTPPRANDQTSPRKNLDAGEDYTNVFHCHAELYVFAVQNEIEELRTLALNRIHSVLARFKLHKERTGDIIALLGYSYSKTKSPDSGKEPLRDLLTQYVAFEMDKLMLDKGFEDLIRDNSDILSDYMSSVLKRIKS